METTCRSSGNGLYCGCFSSSTSLAPRSSCERDAASRSEANAANASRSRNCDRPRRSVPATFLIALTWALPPTLETEMPTLMARRPAQQQRDGAVRLGLLGQVIEDDQSVLALEHPVLADGRAGVRGDVLVAGRVRRRRGHDRGVLHRPGVLEVLLDLSDRGSLLADRDVDAADLAGRIARLPVRPLIDDRVDRDRRLAGLPVADDQLAL